jgi:hypothetical protein
LFLTAQDSDGSDSDVVGSATASSEEQEKKCWICKAAADDDGDDMVLCGDCDKTYHLGCAEPKLKFKPRKRKWTCDHCESEVVFFFFFFLKFTFSFFHFGFSSFFLLTCQEPTHDEDCHVCGTSDRGVIVLCDSCPNVYHLRCLTPPLKV